MRKMQFENPVKATEIYSPADKNSVFFALFCGGGSVLE